MNNLTMRGLYGVEGAARETVEWGKAWRKWNCRRLSTTNLEHHVGVPHSFCLAHWEMGIQVA